jgi:hypothetical protein
MDESKAKIAMGVMGILLILSNGAQYLLKNTGKDVACNNGWKFQETGVHEGQYACALSTSTKYSYCSQVRNSTTGKQNYWCSEATLIQEKQYYGAVWICPPDEKPCIAG